MLIGGTAKNINFALPKPTDLTNTTWLFNDTIDFESIRQFDRNLGIQVIFEDYPTPSNIMTAITQGIFWELSYDNSTAHMSFYRTSDHWWRSEGFKKWTVVGGNNVQNSTLIDWFYENATRTA